VSTSSQRPRDAREVARRPKLQYPTRCRDEAVDRARSKINWRLTTTDARRALRKPAKVVFGLEDYLARGIITAAQELRLGQVGARVPGDAGRSQMVRYQIFI
jgi:hypothetical protein